MGSSGDGGGGGIGGTGRWSLGSGGEDSDGGVDGSSKRMLGRRAVVAAGATATSMVAGRVKVKTVPDVSDIAMTLPAPPWLSVVSPDEGAFVERSRQNIWCDLQIRFEH